MAAQVCDAQQHAALRKGFASRRAVRPSMLVLGAGRPQNPASPTPQSTRPRPACPGAPFTDAWLLQSRLSRAPGKPVSDKPFVTLVGRKGCIRCMGWDAAWRRGTMAPHEAGASLVPCSEPTTSLAPSMTQRMCAWLASGHLAAVHSKPLWPLCTVSK